MQRRSIWLGLFFIACVTPVLLSENIARGKPTMQSSDYSNNAVSGNAVDGNHDPAFNRLSCSHTLRDDENPWWTVDLQGVYTIHQVILYNRDMQKLRLDNVSVEAFLSDPFICTSGVLCAYNPGPSGDIISLNCSQETRARYVRLSKDKGSALTLCEVEIFGEMTSDSEPEIPLFPPLCWFTKIVGVIGQMLTSSVDLGSAPNRLGCLHLCQRRPSCNIVNYNNVSKICSTSTISPLGYSQISSSENWTLYALC